MSATEHEFKAEVQQLLDIVIHSLYSDREIFLRELISNAADALDKARFEGLTRDLVALAGEIPGVRIHVDAEARTLSIDDDGIGMTLEEAIDNLGTIAHSGTAAFLDRLKDASAGEAPQLIGQFGVGFYSAYMVADEVIVDTLSGEPGSEAVRWTSQGAGTYTVEPGERKFRGTRVTLVLREDAAEFLEAPRVKAIVRKHSNYLPWPILVDGEEANAGEAIWAKPANQVSDEDAAAFYKAIAVDWRDPAHRVHVSVDSPIQYHALLFVPDERPYDLYFPDATAGVRLYARRVLIMEQATEILPKWLRFVRGVVDSEDVQLNLSREMVQKTPVVQKIRSALVKRLLKDLARLPDRPWDAEEDEGVSPAERFEGIWRNFGMLLKEGYYSDKYEYGELLLPILRFNALSSEDEQGLLSLADYREAMPEDQDAIWYLTARSREEALASPHLEAFRKRGWDVLLLTEPVDEWLVQALTEFDDLPLKSVARGELDLEDEDEGERADLTGLGPWMSELYGEAISDVRASTRLTDSAVVLVDDEEGISGNLERILRSANQAVPHQARILEVNTRHPLIQSMARLHDAGRTEVLEPLAHLLLDNAVLLDGNVPEPTAIGRRLQGLLERAAARELED